MRIRLARHVARNGGKINAFRVFVGKTVRYNGRSRRRWEDTIKMDLKERVWEVLDWINLTQDSELVFKKVAYESRVEGGASEELEIRRYMVNLLFHHVNR